MNTTALKENIKRAFDIIARMSVSGDNQDLASAAKRELATAYAELEKGEQNEPVSTETPVQG